jgi:hypothetical protein
MRTNRPGDQNIHCLRCYLRQEICICSILPTVQTRAEFLILRHIREARSTSNTGRLVVLAMPNSRIISCGSGSGQTSGDAVRRGGPACPHLAPWSHNRQVGAGVKAPQAIVGVYNAEQSCLPDEYEMKQTTTIYLYNPLLSNRPLKAALHLRHSNVPRGFWG